jgi:hypothetical protein
MGYRPLPAKPADGIVIIPGNLGLTREDIAWLRWHIEAVCELRMLVGPSRPSPTRGEYGAVVIGPREAVIPWEMPPGINPRPPDPGMAECCGRSSDYAHGRGVCYGWKVRKARTLNSGPW